MAPASQYAKQKRKKKPHKFSLVVRGNLLKSQGKKKIRKGVGNNSQKKKV